MKRTTMVFLGGLLLFSVLALSAAADDSSNVTVINDSNWVLVEFYMSPTSTDEWGPDQLGDQVIGTGDRFTLTGVPCETFDIQVIDEDGDECVMEEIDLCANNATWHVTNEELLGCQKETDDDDDD